jgi:putative transposase
VAKIKALHAKSRGLYGSPKIYRQLRRDGEVVNHKRVEKLMKAHAIRAKESQAVSPDDRFAAHLASSGERCGDFTAVHPNEVWTTDITHLD